MVIQNFLPKYLDPLIFFLIKFPWASLTEQIPESDMDSEDADAGIKVFAPERPHDQHGYPRCGTKTDRESESNNFNAQKHDEGGDNNSSGATSQGSDSQNENIST